MKEASSQIIIKKMIGNKVTNFTENQEQVGSDAIHFDSFINQPINGDYISSILYFI